MQEAYNAEHGITPASIVKNIDDVLSSVYERDYVTVPKAPDEREQFRTQAELDAFIAELEREMREAAAQPRVRARGVHSRSTAPTAQSRSRGLRPGEPRSGRVAGVAQARGAGGAGLPAPDRRRSAAASSRGRFTRRDIIEQLDAIGIGSLTVVLLTGTFTGMVLALQSGLTLDQFGARSVVGRLVSASMVKELGPVLTALMVTGRVGSGIAAELGSMMVTDQIAALRALGTDPIRKLVVPRVIAGTLMVPVLTDHRRRASACSAARSFRACSSTSRAASTGTTSSRASTSQDLWMGLIKPFVLGFALVDHRVPRRAAHDGRHAGRRPRDDQRRRGRVGRRARGRLSRDEAPDCADVLR